MHVLAAEANADRVTRMRRVLQPAGIKLTVVGSGEQAMEIVRLRWFDLIILNIRLPGINGLDACRSLKMDPE